MKNFINETEEIKAVTYQEAKKITPEEFWRNEAALQQRANETQEIKGVTYQEAKKITPEEFWRNEALQAALQQQAVLLQQRYLNKGQDD